MINTVKLGDNTNREREDNIFVRLWVRWLVIGCEACAISVIVFLSAILVAWAAMFIVS